MDTIIRMDSHTQCGGGPCAGEADGPKRCLSGHLGSDLVWTHVSGANAEAGEAKRILSCE
jgi:hypothetical protein